MKPAAPFLVLSAAMADPPLAQLDATEAGAEAFWRACAKCHRSAERLVRRLSDGDGMRPERLESFLAGHHAPDETDRRAIIAYLPEL